MVQFLLTRFRRCWLITTLAICGPALLPAVTHAAPKAKTPPTPREFWQMSLDGGRSLSWERSFTSETEVKPNHGFWTKLVNVVAGEPDYKFMVRPYSVATDSRGRIIITDPGAEGVHIFDFEARKYKFIERADKTKYKMLTPQCVAVDAQDNIYVTDSDAGEIFVFEPGGKFLRAIGALKGGEGYFKRPTGLAIDAAEQRIYVSDTLRDKIFVLDMQGTVLQTIGSSGKGEGEFNRPTELRFSGQNLLVVDSMNFRVQVFDRSGKFQYAVGKIGDGLGAMFRPKDVALDSEGDLYVVDGIWGVVQVFNRQGQLLYYFGGEGTHAGQFQLPTGLFIDRDDRVFVVDSFNRRVQIFRYAGLKVPAIGDRR
ncbi:MAG TPA: 6-bladed beta-propeller [Acidobacteriaceae bacterium]|nr:6-bladed beta-propeller [Acidobacteriaceae bacterium]